MALVLEDSTSARDDLAYDIAAQFRRILRRRARRNMNVGDRYLQVAAVTVKDEAETGASDRVDDDAWYALGLEPFDFEYEERPYHLLVEMQTLVDGQPGDPAPVVSAFSEAQSAALAALGFNPPEGSLVNWWGTVDEDEAAAIARATVDAFVDVCDIPLTVVDADLRRWRGPTSKSRRATTFRPVVDDEDRVVDVAGAGLDYAAFALTRRDQISAGWPWTSEVEPAFFAIVDDGDRDSVRELVALAPLALADDRVGWFRRTRRGWIADPTVARRLARARGETLRSISTATARTLEPQLAF